MDRDVYFESQYASTIVKQGEWNPKLGAGFAENYYGYNPVLHFILAFSSITTGLTTYALSKYVYFILLRVMLVLSIFLLISRLLEKGKESIACLATFIFIASFGMAFIEVSRRLIAGIFMILALYSLVKSGSKSDGNVWNILFYLFSALVVIANHSVSYLLLLLLAGMLLFGIFAKTKIFKKLFHNGEDINRDYPNVLYKLIYFFVIFFFWEVFVSTFLLKNDLSYIANIFKFIHTGYGIQLLFSVKGAKPATFIYHSYEILTVYLYHFVFLLLSIIGFLIFIIKLRLKYGFGNTLKNKYLLLYIGLFSLILYVSAFILMRTELDMASYTFLWFFCAPLSIFIAYFMDWVYTKNINRNMFFVFLILISVLFYSGHVFSGMYTPRITSRAPDEDVVIGMDIRSQTSEVYYSAAWLNKSVDENSKVLGDMNIFEIYSGLFEFDVSTDEYQQNLVYNGDLTELNYVLSDNRTYFGSYEHTVHYGTIDYLVINNGLFKYPNYLFGEPVDVKNAQKFDKAYLINKIYDNKEIEIYHNILSKNS